jgi:hypothetical protein
MISPYQSVRFCLRAWLLEITLLNGVAPLLLDEVCEVLVLSGARGIELGGGES